MHGREKSGALASLNSVAKLSYRYRKDGGHLQYVFHRAGSAGQDGRTAPGRISSACWTAHLSEMADHINVNVLSRETLVEAYRSPGKIPQPHHPRFRLRGELPQADERTAARGHRPHVPRGDVSRGRTDADAGNRGAKGRIALRSVHGSGGRTGAALCGVSGGPPVALRLLPQPGHLGTRRAARNTRWRMCRGVRAAVSRTLHESGGRHGYGRRAAGPSPASTAALLKALRAEGYHTALDNLRRGCSSAAAREVLAHPDPVLAGT